jgi:hypothetical protein
MVNKTDYLEFTVGGILEVAEFISNSLMLFEYPVPCPLCKTGRNRLF